MNSPYSQKQVLLEGGRVGFISKVQNLHTLHPHNYRPHSHPADSILIASVARSRSAVTTKDQGHSHFF